MRQPLIGAAVIAAFSTSAVLGHEAVFRALDLDGDGRVSSAEAKALTPRTHDPASAGASAIAPTPRDHDVFRRLDRNNDGYLSDAELWRAKPRPGGGWMVIDRDNDGRISPGEFSAIR